MSCWQADTVWGASTSAGRWTLHLRSVVLYQGISTACNTAVSGWHSIWALTLAEFLFHLGIVSPLIQLSFFFFFSWCCYCLFAHPVRMGSIQFHCVPFSLELGRLSPCIYWPMSRCQLANLEGNWSHLCQTVTGAVVTRRNRILGSASALFYHPSGKFQNFFQYLGSKEIFQLHLAKVIRPPPLFFSF